MRKDIAKLLETGQEATARIRVSLVGLYCLASICHVKAERSSLMFERLNV